MKAHQLINIDTLELYPLTVRIVIPVVDTSLTCTAKVLVFCEPPDNVNSTNGAFENVLPNFTEVSL